MRCGSRPSRSSATRAVGPKSTVHGAIPSSRTQAVLPLPLLEKPSALPRTTMRASTCPARLSVPRRRPDGDPCVELLGCGLAAGHLVELLEAVPDGIAGPIEPFVARDEHVARRPGVDAPLHRRTARLVAEDERLLDLVGVRAGRGGQLLPVGGEGGSHLRALIDEL